MAQTIQAPVTLTEGAYKEIKKIFEQSDITEEHGLRIGVKGGGCSGMSYLLGIDKKMEGDVEYDIQGFRVFMNQAHGMYLTGMQIDFAQGLDARGFIFENPNASSACGCGESFAV